MDIIDNRAKGVPCYDPGYTFVEKLQTISTKFRKQEENGSGPVEFMRHYHDVHELLRRPEAQKFIGTDAYKAHKQARFRKDDNQNIAENAPTPRLYRNISTQRTGLSGRCSAASNGKQTSWEHTSPSGEFYFNLSLGNLIDKYDGTALADRLFVIDPAKKSHQVIAGLPIGTSRILSWIY